MAKRSSPKKMLMEPNGLRSCKKYPGRFFNCTEGGLGFGTTVPTLFAAGVDQLNKATI